MKAHTAGAQAGVREGERERGRRNLARVDECKALIAPQEKRLSFFDSLFSLLINMQGSNQCPKGQAY